MCFSTPKMPPPPSLPPPPPEPSRPVDPAVQRARQDTIQRARAASGPTGTILTSGRNLNEMMPTGKTLLGQ